jgi:hypothetical protein
MEHQKLWIRWRRISWPPHQQLEGPDYIKWLKFLLDQILYGLSKGLDPDYIDKTISEEAQKG